MEKNGIIKDRNSFINAPVVTTWGSARANRTPLFFAFIYNQPENMNLLLKYGAKPELMFPDKKLSGEFVVNILRKNSYKDMDSCLEILAKICPYFLTVENKDKLTFLSILKEDLSDLKAEIAYLKQSITSFVFTVSHAPGYEYDDLCRSLKDAEFKISNLDILINFVEYKLKQKD
jgi:hypothetical protein